MNDTIRLPKTIEHVGVDALLAYPKNSRTHSADQVAAVARSIRAYGFTNPILIHGATIIAGHGRVMAAKQIGMATVPAIRLDHLTEAEARAYVIADNRLAELAGWDEAILAEELRELQALDFDIDLTGFDIGFLDSISGRVNEIGMPALPTGEKSPFQQMTFTLHDSQADKVRAAMKIAARMGEYIGSQNENGNGNALARICERFIENHGDR